MQELEVAPLLDVQWPVVDHRFARAHLERLGWVRCSEGDWAYAHQSPSGRLLARVSPFEPAYTYFLELCQRCPGNRHLPRIELASPLEGGGHLTVLEYLTCPDGDVVEKFLRHLEDPEGANADLGALRNEVDTIDAWGRQHVRWWGGVDIGARHVLLSTDGNLKLIDLFFVAGSDLLAALLDDPGTFARHVPPDRRRYLLDIPELQYDHPADYLRRLRDALDAAACHHPGGRSGGSRRGGTDAR